MSECIPRKKIQAGFGGGLVTKTYFHTSLLFSRAKCDICIDIDPKEYPNIFTANDARKIMWWTKNKCAT